MGNDPVEEPEAEALVGIDHRTAEDQLESLGGSDEAGKEIGTTPIGVEPDLVERLSDGRLLGCDSDVTRQCEVGPTAGRGSVHTGDHRFGRVVNDGDHLTTRLDEGAERLGVLSLRQLPHVPDVGTGTERSAGTRDHQDPDVLVLGHLSDGLGDLLPHRPGKGVQLVRPIERDRPDAVVDGREDVLERGDARRHMRSTMVAMPCPTPIHIVASP